eukprot:gene1700-16176_t
MAQLNKDLPDIVPMTKLSVLMNAFSESHLQWNRRPPSSIINQRSSCQSDIFNVSNNIVPNTKEPTATLIDTLSPDQPMAQLNKDVHQLDPYLQVESETAVSHHQPADLPAKVTSSMVNNIVPNTKEPKPR